MGSSLLSSRDWPIHVEPKHCLACDEACHSCYLFVNIVFRLFVLHAKTIESSWHA